MFAAFCWACAFDPVAAGCCICWSCCCVGCCVGCCCCIGCCCCCCAGCCCAVEGKLENVASATAITVAAFISRSSMEHHPVGPLLSRRDMLLAHRWDGTNVAKDGFSRQLIEK